MKNKIVALFALFSVVFTVNAYAAQFFHDNAELGHSEEINCSTGLDCGKVAGKMTISVEDPLSLDDATVETITVTYYATLPYYTTLNWPGSGAPVGSMMTKGGPTGNCGNANGTTVNVCASDGTNWRLV